MSTAPHSVGRLFAPYLTAPGRERERHLPELSLSSTAALSSALSPQHLVDLSTFTTPPTPPPRCCVLGAPRTWLGLEGNVDRKVSSLPAGTSPQRQPTRGPVPVSRAIRRTETQRFNSPPPSSTATAILLSFQKQR